jgi:hypothetical protein
VPAVEHLVTVIVVAQVVAPHANGNSSIKIICMKMVGDGGGVARMVVIVMIVVVVQW